MNRRTRVAIASMIFAPIIALSACSSEPKTQVEEAVGAEVDAPRVNVFEVGANPVQLRYTDQDAEQTSSISVAQGFEQKVFRADAVEPKAPAGGNVETFRAKLVAETVTPDNTDSGASRSVSIDVTEPEVDNLELTEDVRGAEGFHFGWFATDTGQPTSVNLAAPTGASDKGRALLEKNLMPLIPLAVVFPEDPIGVGGKWTVDARVAGDTTTLMTTTYTVTAIDGDTVSLDVSINERPALGALSLDLESGVQNLHVLSTDTYSEGTITLDLKKPLPTTGEIKRTTRVVYGEDATINRVVQDNTTAVTFS